MIYQIVKRANMRKLIKSETDTDLFKLNGIHNVSSNHVSAEFTSKYTTDYKIRCEQDSFAILLKLIFDFEFRKNYLPKGDFSRLIVLFANTGYEHCFTYEFIDKIVKPLCKGHGVKFVSIEPEMGFHSESW